MDDCPQCGEPTETLYEGYCEQCRDENQARLNEHNAWLDRLRARLALAWDKADNLDADKAKLTLRLNSIVNILNARDKGDGCGSFDPVEKLSMIRRTIWDTVVEGHIPQYSTEDKGLSEVYAVEYQEGVVDNDTTREF